MSPKRSIILHNDNIGGLPSDVENVCVVHVSLTVTGAELKQQAIEKYQLQRLAASDPDRILLYASPLGAYRTRVDTLSVVPLEITDVYVRIVSATSPLPTFAPL